MARKFLLSFTLLLITAFAFSTALAAPSATEQVKSTIDKVLAVLQDGGLSNDAKRDKIRKVISERFDWRGMSIRTLGKNWKGASKEQKKRFTAAYRRLLEDTYLVMVEEYTDEKVDFVKEDIKKQKYAQVNTLIVRTGAPPIPVNYKARLRKDKWWIYDVVIEGVSMISNYRTSYQQIAKNQGLDGLIAQIEEKVATGDTPAASSGS
ncbi:MAG: ABC transporter substrate-binding protein [Gammaproteobacteria bacterium]|nr:ABC transporter substrate-binding protein [Gammaproteobacteria bacterium]MDJ0871226.1 ABC transporter substrate-binding protein [Gammaproteobacteria bacterium]